MNEFTPIPQNYKNNVNWIIGAYIDAGVSFPNGFQKDAIQNAVGARKTNRWKNWNCDISVISNNNGIFLVIEDSGTVGLIGENIPANKVNEMMAKGEVLPPEERLSRFTSMFNSGGNTTGGGLFGAGKSVYSVASENYTYYFDSLRDDNKYVANVNKCGQVYEKAFEDKAAKEFIYKNTGLEEKKTVGTRIIIESPKDELVESINKGTIIPFIQESWWLIIQKFDETSSITVNKKRISIPNNIKKTTKKYELSNAEIYLENYRVKHFGLFVFEKGDNLWKGISYYRKGMKIGDVEIKDVPEKLADKYWGYIEVDETWEDDLAEIEDKVHFGVSKGKKLKIAYQNLKNYCNEKVKVNLVNWGYIKDKENEDKKLKDELNQIAENIQNLFDNLGFEDLGKGPQKPDFDVRWQDIEYPIANSEKVTIGDKIKFSIRIKSLYSTEKKFEYKLIIIDQSNGTLVSQIEVNKITIKPNTIYKKDFIYEVSKDTSKQYAENRIVLSVKVVGSGKEKRKELPFFFDVEHLINSADEVSLSLHECIFPIEGSRRVNYDEKIKNVCYRIENKRNHELKYKLNISIHNAQDASYPKILDVASYEGNIKPFEETITPYIDEIKFDKAIFAQHLDEGELELRARLIANDDNDKYEKGDKIASYKLKIYLNKDEKNGKENAFDPKSIYAPENYRRSWCVPGSARVIYINVGHEAYLNLQDYPDIQHEYLKEQMLKQYVLLYLNEGKYDTFKHQGKDFSELEPQEAVDEIIEKIESVYAKSLA